MSPTTERARRRALLLDAAATPEPGPCDTIITLSAGAEYACRRDGIAHLDLSAVASERELAGLQDAYWADQLAWMGLLEQRLNELSPSLAATGARPVVACGYLLKLLVDSLFVRGFESAALTSGEWSELTHHVRAEGPQLLGDVLPLFCASRGIGYSRVTEPSRSHERSRVGHGRVRASVAPAAHVARQVAGARPRRRTPSAGALRLLALTPAYDSADLLRRNALLGGPSLMWVRGRVLEIRRGVPRTLARPEVVGDAEWAEWREIAEALKHDQGLARWPASWFGGELGALVMERVSRWVAVTLPEVMAAVRSFATLYETGRVDTVVAPFLSGPAEAGAFAAARTSGRTNAVLIEHGDIAYSAASWDLNLLAADAVIVPTEEIADHLIERGRRYPQPTADVLVGSYRWQRYARLGSSRRPRRRRGVPPVDLGHVDPGKQTLVYLVTALASDSRYVNNAWYPDAWYFGLQVAIVDALARHDRFNVVVKLFPATEHDLSPLADYVADRRAPNVTTSRAPFTEWLPLADRVVADMASTGLYEALVAGVPAMSLLWSNHTARPGAVEALGEALQPFTTHADAAAVVDRFAAEPRPRTPVLQPEGGDILESLRRLVRT